MRLAQPNIAVSLIFAGGTFPLGLTDSVDLSPVFLDGVCADSWDGDKFCSLRGAPLRNGPQRLVAEDSERRHTPPPRFQQSPATQRLFEVRFRRGRCTLHLRGRCLHRGAGSPLWRGGRFLLSLPLCRRRGRILHDEFDRRSFIRRSTGRSESYSTVRYLLAILFENRVRQPCNSSPRHRAQHVFEGISTHLATRKQLGVQLSRRFLLARTQYRQHPEECRLLLLSSSPETLCHTASRIAKIANAANR